MTLTDNPTYYEILDVKPEASPAEIRQAYLRTKNTYNKDSVALYTMVTPEEREEILRQIEEAYETLSNPEKRKEYDRCHGMLDPEDDLPYAKAPSRRVISIDRAPPMEDHGDGSDLLIPPSTDIGHSDHPFFASEAPIPSPFGRSTSSSPFDPAPAPAPQPRAPQASPLAPAPAPVSPSVASAPAAPSPVQIPALPKAAARPGDPAAALLAEIEAETDWSGDFLKKIREARRISIEEMSSSTKINKSYLIAIEDENFGKLPAPVFVRGFIIQIARILLLPPDRVAAAFMSRMNRTGPSRKR